MSEHRYGFGNYLPTSSKAYIAIITGGRNYHLTSEDIRWLGHMWEKYGFRIVLHGGAPGADSDAAQWARSIGLCDAACEAQWDFWEEQGKRHYAGPERNARMAAACGRYAPGINAVCLAFPGRRGTQNMIKQCYAHEIPVERSPGWP